HSSKPQTYETSTYPQWTPLQQAEGGYWEAEVLREDTQDYPSNSVSSHQEREDFEAESPQSRNENWCSFMQSRLVTYIEACMKEKYIVNSQQPCPNGAPDCQKIMYRTALKPIYQVKQKVWKSLQWKCCPGFIGKDCEQRDPNFILVPANETEGLEEEEFSNHSISAYNDIMTLKNDIKHLSLAIKRHESRADINLCCNHTILNAVEPLNISVEILSADLATIKQKLEEHLWIFKKLFGSNEELVASNVSLDITKIQSMLTRKVRRQQKGHDKQRDKKKSEKHRENTQTISGRNTVQTELLEKGPSVAFHVGFSEGSDTGKTLRFNETHLNYGNSYFPEHGYFKAPHRGVYLFVISVEFSSGPAIGQLSFSRGYKRTLSSSQRKTANGNTMTTFAIAEMEKGERVCFELLQGSVVKRSPPGTTMGGFLIFKT
ncbi:Multimerin-2, partial [Struthio camelus australis]